MVTAMRPGQRFRRRQVSLVAAAAGFALLLTGCGVLPGFSSSSGGDGGNGASSAPVTEPTPSATDEAPEPTPSPTVIFKQDDSPDPDTSSDTDSDKKSDDGVDAGTIEVGFENGGAPRIINYKANDCVVGADYIMANGTGTDPQSGLPSEVGIFSEPAEALGENTPLIQAAGIISVRTGDETIVSDGRPKTVSGHTMPAMFIYEPKHNSVKYAVAWFNGDADAGTGWVKVHCNY